MSAATVDLELPRLHTGQRRIATEARRFNVLACGRRFGKSTFGIDRIVHPALAGYPVGYFAPTYKMLTEVWRDARRTLEPVTRRADASEHRLELVTGGVVDMWSLDNPNTSRGRKYKRIAVDEAAMIPDLEEAWNAVIRPTLTDYRGDAWFMSTPKGLNFFHALYQFGQDEARGDWASWRMPTVANPHIDPSEVEAARRELPDDVFQQEYLAEFLQNEGAVFRGIAGSLRDVAEDRPERHLGHVLVMGGDWGRSNDFTALSVFCATCMEEVELRRFNLYDWAFQRQMLEDLGRKWSVRYYLLEHNSIGGPNIEELQRAGLPVYPFETTATSKPPLVESLKLAFDRREARWLDVPYARAELAAYSVRLNAVTGRASYSAPSGQHDDTVIARCLAWKAALDGGPALTAESVRGFTGAYTS